MKKLLPVAVLAIAACTQEPVRVVLKGDQFFGQDQFASNESANRVGFNPHASVSRIEIQQEAYAEPQRVESVGVSELPPLQGAYQTSAFRDNTRPEARVMAAPQMQQQLAEIQMAPPTPRPYVSPEETAARFAPAAMQVESPSASSETNSNWYQGRIVLAKAEMVEQPEAVNAQPAPFIWPVRGKVISPFGPKSNGLHNDGINIAAELGAPIYASADGVVVYAGNDLKGYGNMVILRHENGWMTAYAHANQLMVDQNTRVRQGQKIATVGATGSVESAQLHFGLRNGKTPVDPAQYLNSNIASR